MPSSHIASVLNVNRGDIFFSLLYFLMVQPLGESKYRPLN